MARRSESPVGSAVMPENHLPDKVAESREEGEGRDREAAAESRAPARETLPPVPDDAVARRAYEIYCERGSEHGHAMDDWLQAERELRTRPE